MLAHRAGPSGSSAAEPPSQGPLTSLKRHKLDVDVVGSGTECGLVLDWGRVSAFQPGDVLQCFEAVRVRATGGA
jgi:translation initiation factor IF-2